MPRKVCFYFLYLFCGLQARVQIKNCVFFDLCSSYLIHNCTPFCFIFHVDKDVDFEKGLFTSASVLIMLFDLHARWISACAVGRKGEGASHPKILHNARSVLSCLKRSPACEEATRCNLRFENTVCKLRLFFLFYFMCQQGISSQG